MNKVLRIGIIAICLGFIFSTVSLREAKAQNILGEILRRMDNHNKSLQSLKADVVPFIAAILHRENEHEGNKDSHDRFDS